MVLLFGRLVGFVWADAEGTWRGGGRRKLLLNPACVAKRGIRSAQGARVAVHAVPGLGVVLEQLGQDQNERLARGDMRAAAVLQEEPRVAGFLPGQDLGKEHGRVRGKRFLYECAAGLAYEHVLLPQK